MIELFQIYSIELFLESIGYSKNIKEFLNKELTIKFKKKINSYYKILIKIHAWAKRSI